MATLLVSLPQTILDAILDEEMSPSVIKLWFCGDRLLQYKLATGITQIRLSDHRELTLRRWDGTF